MNCFSISASLPALLGLGACTSATVVSADKFTYEGGRFTLEPSALARRLTLFTYDPATSGH
jgi:hypothetical protein